MMGRPLRTRLLTVAGSYHFFSRDTSGCSNYTTGAYGDDTVSGDYDIQADTTGLLEYNFEGEGHAEGEGGSGGGPTSPSIGGHFVSDAWTIAEANGQSHYHASDVGSFDEEGSEGAVTVDYTDSHLATHESGQTTTATDTDYLAAFTMTAGAFDDELVVYGEDGTYETDGTSAGLVPLTIEGNSDFSYGTAHDVTVTLPGGSAGGGGVPGGPPVGGGGGEEGGGVATSLATLDIEDDDNWTYSDGGAYDEEGRSDRRVRQHGRHPPAHRGAYGGDPPGTHIQAGATEKARRRPT